MTTRRPDDAAPKNHVPKDMPEQSSYDDDLNNLPLWAADDLADDAIAPDDLAELFTALSRALPPQPAPPGLRARLLAAVAAPEHRFGPFAARLARLIDVAHDRARALLTDLARPDIWQPFLPAVDLVHLPGGPAVAGADVGFVRLAAGATFPMHRHLGDERVLILQGAFKDSDGTTHHAGAELHQPPGSSHSFTALPGPDLIYAVVVFGVEIPDAPPLH